MTRPSGNQGFEDGLMPERRAAHELAVSFLARCKSIPTTSLERSYQHVPLRSSKITSLAQIRSALQAVWISGTNTGASIDMQATFLGSFWDSLAEQRRELRASEKVVRAQLRPASLATSAIGIGVYFAVAAEMFRHTRNWNAECTDLLADSVLARTVDPAVSLERHAAATLRAEQSGMNKRPRPAPNFNQPGPSLSKGGTPFAASEGPLDSSIEASVEFTLHDPSDAVEADFGDQRADGLALAADLVRASVPTRDFFDLAAPWWRAGGCVSVNEEAAVRTFRQTKGSHPKIWAGALAVRLLPPRN